MDTRRFGSGFSNRVGRAVLILVLVIFYVIGLCVVSGPIMARREAQTKDRHIRSIEQLVVNEDWAGVKEYISDNELYGSEYQKYMDVCGAKVRVAFIENCISQMEKYANIPLSDYYTEKDKQEAIRNEAEIVVGEFRAYRSLYAEVYDRGIEGNESSLKEYLTAIESFMENYGFSEDEIMEMYRDDSYDYREHAWYLMWVDRITDYYITK